jgi:ribonuclease R
VGRRSGRQYCLGDRVEVQIKGVDYYRQQIDLVAVISSEGDGAVSDETQPPSAELVDTETEDLQLAQSEGLEE